MLWLSLPPLPRFFAVAGLFVLASSGCMSLNPAQDLAAMTGFDGGAAVVPPPTSISDAPPREVVVQLRPQRGGPELVKVPMEGDESVESILKKSKATSRFGRMKVSLFRSGRKGAMANEPLRVEYDSGARQVPAQYDYALQPGDKLLVIEDSRSAFEEMMGQVFGPFAGTRN
jgi:hypothetical protein